MWRTPRNAETPEAGTTHVVRRVEVTVERQMCSVEVHGDGQLPYGSPCPWCGQVLVAPDDKSGLELPAGTKVRGEGET
jgi:hypothetical protein